MLLSKLDLSLVGAEDICLVRALSPVLFSPADHFPEG